MSIPNSITFTRIFLIPFAILALFIDFAYHYEAALIIYVLASSSDFIDGYLARKLKQETHMGILLDPMADKLLHILLLFSLAYLGIFQLWIVMLLIAREIIVDTFLSFASSKKVFLKPPFFAKFKSFFIDIAVILGELFLITQIETLKIVAFVFLIVSLILGSYGGGPYLKMLRNNFKQ